MYDQVWLSVIDEESIVFKVRACSDVHIGLSRYPGISYVEMYEIVIGGWGNTKSVIRTSMQQEHPEAELDEADTVSCDSSRHFWVSWPNGRIAFGRGSHVGSREMLHWTDPNPHEVTAVGITNAADNNGTWEFSLPKRKHKSKML